MQIVPASVLMDIARGSKDHRSRREASWYGYADGETWGALPFAVDVLYRGQNKRHFPLLPSIARGLRSQDIAEIWRCSHSDQAAIVLRLAQSWWFSLELSKHPISNAAAQQKLDLDAIAVAQHYGIPTGYLDLTDDFCVAAFFATCRHVSMRWEPMNSGMGIVYRSTLKSLSSPFGRFVPLGPQPLPRPSEQCAWVTELPLCHSFEWWPDVASLRFEHDRAVGEYFLKMFEGGEKLFPKDPLAEIAAEILSCREIPTDIVDAALDSFANDPLGIMPSQVAAIRREIIKLSAFVNRRSLLTEHHVSTLLADEAWCSKMLGEVRVKWRAIRRVPVKDAGLGDT